jgi:hypothetical protein
MRKLILLALMGVLLASPAFGGTFYGADTQLWVGNSNGYTNRILVKFSLSEIEGMDYTHASLVLEHAGGGVAPKLLNLHLVEGAWSESSVTWSTAPAFSAEPLLSQEASGGGEQVFDVTQAISGTSLSLLVKADDETLDYASYKVFFSSETSSGPKLRFYYENPEPVIEGVSVPDEGFEGQPVSLSFVALDDDLEALRIYVDGTLLAESAEGEWLPDYMDAGLHEVMFYARDAVGQVVTHVTHISVTDVTHVTLNELMPHPLAGEPNWIELFNPTEEAFEVTGCTIKINTNSYPIAGTINPGSFGMVTGILNFNPEAGLVSLQCSGLLYDKVAYGTYNDGNAEDNAPASPQGSSVGRKLDGQDTDNDIADFRTFSVPTPGEPNYIETFHDADTNQDGCLSLSELLTYISLWKADPMGTPMANLLSAIALYKDNPMC